MPFTYKYIPDSKVILLRPVGVITLEEIKAVYEAAMIDPTIPSGVVSIVPFQEIESFTLNEDDHWRLQGYFKYTKSKRKSLALIIIASQLFHIGMARVYQSIFDETGSWETHIVKTNEEAFELSDKIIQKHKT